MFDYENFFYNFFGGLYFSFLMNLIIYVRIKHIRKSETKMYSLVQSKNIENYLMCYFLIEKIRSRLVYDLNCVSVFQTFVWIWQIFFNRFLFFFAFVVIVEDFLFSYVVPSFLQYIIVSHSNKKKARNPDRCLVEKIFKIDFKFYPKITTHHVKNLKNNVLFLFVAKFLFTIVKTVFGLYTECSLMCFFFFFWLDIE